MDARDVAAGIHEWARSNGLLADGRGATGQPTSLGDMWHASADDVLRAERGLAGAHIIGVVVDEANQRVAVVARNALGPRKTKPFPKEIGGVAVDYIGQVNIEPNPPVAPHSSQLPQTPWRLHHDRFACGGSITAAPVPGAGTMGALVRLADGRLCGLTNNHVTGDCNPYPAGHALYRSTVLRHRFALTCRKLASYAGQLVTLCTCLGM